MDQKAQYIDYKSILIVDTSGKMKKLEVPFKVYVKLAHSNEQLVHEVMEVLCTEKDELVYVIHSKRYFHYHFVILI